MNRERILSLLGYDPELLAALSIEDRNAVRASAVVWLIACMILGGAAGYSAALIQPTLWGALLAGVCVTALMVNLLRVVNAGGGSPLRRNLGLSKASAAKYRPSLVPAVVFGVLAAILSQPGQLPFWPELEHDVEEHRQALIDQHNIAAADLGTDADYYREELESAGFPIFRIQLIWKDPRRAIRMTAILCLLVLLPAFWSQVVSLAGHRAYELARCERAHASIAQLRREGRAEVAQILGQWGSYQPSSPWLLRRGKPKLGPWLQRSES